MSKKVLLTSVCRPMGPQYGDAPSVGYELLYRQVTRAQGIFSPRTVNVHFRAGLHRRKSRRADGGAAIPVQARVDQGTQEGLRLRGRLVHHGGDAQDEGDGRADPQIRAEQQDRPRRLRHGVEGRRAQAVCGFHLPRGRRGVLPPAAGRTGNSDALQTSADRELAEGVRLEGFRHGKNLRRPRLPERLRFLLHVAFLFAQAHQAAADRARHLQRRGTLSRPRSEPGLSDSSTRIFC